jgi:hypothetical protein
MEDPFHVCEPVPHALDGFPQGGDLADSLEGIVVRAKTVLDVIDLEPCIKKMCNFLFICRDS